MREAALAGRLGAHPHIVTAHEAGEWEQRPYVAFEYMPNGSLAEQLRDKGTPPRPQALQWLAQAAAAVDHAHRAKVVHRDIKPANLLLDADGNLSVADFGVSRRDGEATLTAEGDVVGTAGYLAPEQVDGRGAIAASDRFALGVVAHQLLTGRLPTADRRELTASVEAVFDRALADEPERRYPTATASSMRFELRWRPIRLRPCPRRRGRDSFHRGRHPALAGPGGAPVGRAAQTARPALARRRRAPRRSAVAAPATAGGVVLGRRLAGTQPPRAQPRDLVTRCAVSPFDADANVVVSGVGAVRSAARRPRRSRRKATTGPIGPTRACSRRTAAIRVASAASARSPGPAGGCDLRRPRAADRDRPLPHVRRRRLGATQLSPVS